MRSFHRALRAEFLPSLLVLAGFDGLFWYGLRYNGVQPPFLSIVHIVAACVLLMMVWELIGMYYSERGMYRERRRRGLPEASA